MKIISRVGASILASGFFALIVLCYQNCGPTNFSKNFESIQGNPMAPISNELLFGICGVINRCYPQVNLDQCQTGVLSTTGFAGPLGVSSNYSTFSSIEQGEQSGALSGNSSAGSSCYGSINQLSCSSPTVI